MKKTCYAVLLCCLIGNLACKKSSKEIWLESSKDLREASRIYLALSESLNMSMKTKTITPNAPDDPENNKALNLGIVGFSAAFYAKQCTETADKLETYARFDKPTQEEFAETLKSMKDIMDSAENSITNKVFTSNLHPDERQGFIDAHAKIKKASDSVNRSKID